MRQFSLLALALAAFSVLSPTFGWPANKLFKAPQLYSQGIGGGSSSIAIADVNADGNLDLIEATSCPACGGIPQESGAAVALGKGDGTFGPSRIYPSGGISSRAVAVGDLNGDGKPDIVVSNGCMITDYCNRGSVGVLLGLGNGDFLPAVIYDSGGWWAESVALEDVTGDGTLDILSVNQVCLQSCIVGKGAVGILVGKGDGTFQPTQVVSSGGGESYSIAVQDVNGDHMPDLLIANRDDSNVSVLLANGGGTFRAATNYSSGAYFTYQIATLDADDDGKPDLILANLCLSEANCQRGVITVLFGNGDGTFGQPRTYDSPGYATLSLAIGDVSREGKPDIVATNACIKEHRCSKGTVGLFLGGSGGMFQPAITYNLPVTGTSAAVGDLNSDGKLDVVVGGGGGTSVLINIARIPTATSLASTPNPSVFGEAVALTAIVSSSGQIAPTGKVTFKAGGVAVGSALLNTGVAKLVTKKLPVGSLSIVATYKGDAESDTSTSPALIQVVNPAPQRR